MGTLDRIRSGCGVSLVDALVDRSRSSKERLEERVAELEQQKEELETKIDVLDLEHFKLSGPEERALFEKWRKDLKERLRTDVEWSKRVTRKHEEEE